MDLPIEHNHEQRGLIPNTTVDAQLIHDDTERAAFETALIHAGRTANESHLHDIFAEYHATCRPNTLKRHYYDLRCLCEFLFEQRNVTLTPQQLALSAESWRGMTYGLVADFRAWMLQRGFSLGTINNRLAAVRQYCRLAGPPPKGAGVLTNDEFTAILTVSGYNGKVARNVDRNRTSSAMPTRVGNKKADFTRVSPKEMTQLRKTTTPPPAPSRIHRDHDVILQARDAVMWSLLEEHLLRVGELVSLDIENVDFEENTITVYREKGDETWVYEMGPQTEANMRVYLKQLEEIGRESGPLFLGYGGKKMTTSAINKRVGILGAQLGFGNGSVQGKKEKIKGKPRQRLSPHDLRHYGAIELLNEGTPLNELQAIGGWRTAHMPLHYAKVSKDAVIRSPKRKKQAEEEK
ncbi:MAG TPA: tyrosine-type recombinase/integrase [Ktedonobacteraceae bacterium]